MFTAANRRALGYTEREPVRFGARALRIFGCAGVIPKRESRMAEVHSQEWLCHRHGRSAQPRVAVPPGARSQAPDLKKRPQVSRRERIGVRPELQNSRTKI